MGTISNEGEEEEDRTIGAAASALAARRSTEMRFNLSRSC